ncbi:hypothetical protein [Mesorhizobium sp. LSJC264A00]|nr:hypothetical protein [Mesorhizobium sp. LSJC264A00]
MAKSLKLETAKAPGVFRPAPHKKVQLPGAVHTASEMRTAFGISLSF